MNDDKIKCPNCGAPLKKNDNNSDIICEYCGKSLYIKKEIEKKAILDNEKKSSSLIKFFDSCEKFFSSPLFALIFTPFALVICALMYAKNNFDLFVNEDIETNNYAVNLSSIDSISLKTFNDASKSQLALYIDYTYTFTNKEKWESCGFLFLKPKEKAFWYEDEISNILVDVLKRTIEGDGTEMTLYGALRYYDIGVDKNGVVNHSFQGFISLDQLYLFDNKYFFWGYTGIDSLYDDLLQNHDGEFYVEKSENFCT